MTCSAQDCARWGWVRWTHGFDRLSDPAVRHRPVRGRAGPAAPAGSGPDEHPDDRPGRGLRDPERRAVLVVRPAPPRRRPRARGPVLDAGRLDLPAIPPRWL